jgi:hypothetical protein
MAPVSKQKALFTALTTAWLALAVIFAGIFVIEEHDHDCTGEDCHICLEIQIAQRLIEAFGRLGVSIAVIGFFSYAGSLIKPQLLSYSKKPIELKVRFNF